ncbi:hypothetical protein SAMN05444370_11913 [Rubrimonas cliftonensis]|uniref:Uncharacterized protein n=2 Tax=Rubrimonas cliftonensis TaxID=89524 RepID=A0A1H4F8E9_9RHOB|nr:hypothetical protein SAMN05444370_11913 [Rubrimonas cliftonensis]
MHEAWMFELLRSVRDIATASAMPRLAEHLDDAILIAASEVHEHLAGQDGGRVNDGQVAAALRGDTRKELH